MYGGSLHWVVNRLGTIEKAGHEEVVELSALVVAW